MLKTVGSPSPWGILLSVPHWQNQEMMLPRIDKGVAMGQQGPCSHQWKIHSGPGQLLMPGAQKQDGYDPFRLNHCPTL